MLAGDCMSDFLGIKIIRADEGPLRNRCGSPRELTQKCHSLECGNRISVGEEDFPLRTLHAVHSVRRG